MPNVSFASGALGLHVLYELHGCEPELLKDVAGVRELLLRAAAACGASVISDSFHQFTPYGVSGIIVLAESHLAIHTWPEHGFAAIDLFTCSPRLRIGGLDRRLRASFRGKKVETRQLLRGRVKKAAPRRKPK